MNVMSLKEGGASIQNVTLENAGTLSERVTDVTSIKELTIVGPINGTDSCQCGTRLYQVQTGGIHDGTRSEIASDAL